MAVKAAIGLVDRIVAFHALGRVGWLRLDPRWKSLNVDSRSKTLIQGDVPDLEAAPLLRRSVSKTEPVPSGFVSDIADENTPA
jgi:hypothetical protein